MFVSNKSETYKKYFDAYKELTINLAKLLIQENGNGSTPNDEYLNGAWEKLLQIETKIAEVIFVVIQTV